MEPMGWVVQSGGGQRKVGVGGIVEVHGVGGWTVQSGGGRPTENFPSLRFGRGKVIT